MKIEQTYPPVPRQRMLRVRWIRFLRWPFLFAAYICPILNLFTGGKAWSVVVVWSLWMVWSIGIAPSLVECNVISQLLKGITESCVLLLLIDRFLAPGFAVEVVPIVCYSGLIISGVLLFSDMERQQQNMMPLLLLCTVSILCAVAGLCVFGRQENAWALLVMGALAFALLVACFARLGGGFFRSVRKYFTAE